MKKHPEMEKLAQLAERKKNAEELKAKSIKLAEREETGKQEVSVDLSFFFHNLSFYHPRLLRRGEHLLRWKNLPSWRKESKMQRMLKPGELQWQKRKRR